MKQVKLQNFSKELGEYAKKDINSYKKAIIDALMANFEGLVKESPV